MLRKINLAIAFASLVCAPGTMAAPVLGNQTVGLDLRRTALFHPFTTRTEIMSKSTKS